MFQFPAERSRHFDKEADRKRREEIAFQFPAERSRHFDRSL